MAEAPTLPRPTADPDAGRTIRPRRSLPGGRAVVGAFLVVVAAVGTFGAHLSATAAPDTSYMVATRAFEIGHVIQEADLVGPAAGFRAVPIDLPDDQAARAIMSSTGDANVLLGTVVVAPVAEGDLLQRTHFVDVQQAGDGVSMSFSLPVDRALAGRVGAGERVDVIATFTVAGGGNETRLVARDVTVVATSSGGDGLDGGRVTLTVELPDLATAQELQHAVDTAEVAVLRGGHATDQPPVPTRSDAEPAAQSDGRAEADGVAPNGGASSSQEQG